MKKLLVFILIYLSIISCVVGQIDPTEQIEPASGENYFLLSGSDGKFRPVLHNDQSANGITYQFQNGLNETNGVTGLGGLIQKHTIVQDPSDLYDLLFKKGNAQFGFEASDLDGWKSFNVTNTEDGDTSKLSVYKNALRLNVKGDNGNTNLLAMTSDVFLLSKSHEATNTTWSQSIFGNSYAMNMSNGTNTSSFGFTGSGQIGLSTTNSDVTHGIEIGASGISLRTPMVESQTAGTGWFLSLTDSINGKVDFTNEIPSNFVQTPSLDFDGDGNSFNELTGQLQDIYDALQGQTQPTFQNLTWDPNTSFLGITNGTGVTLPINTSGGDNWGTQSVVTDNTLSGGGTATSPLSVVNTTSPNSRYDYREGISTHDGAYIGASTQNVTYSRTGNKVRITIPAGTILYSLDVFGTFNNLGSEDDYFIELDYQGVSFNQDYETARPPLFALYRTYQDNRMNPSEVDYWQSTHNSPPYVYNQVTQVGGGLIQSKLPDVRSSGTTNFIITAMRLCQGN